MLIVVDELSHIYAAGTPLARNALRSVSLSISPGERLGIAGPTGSGKSTLIQHLAGVLKPSSGRVLLEGVPASARGRESHSRRRRVGIAFQYPEEQVFEQTVAREVAFGPRNLGLDPREVNARVQWALNLVGLEPRAVLDRSPFSLSGGELRRVSLAGVLALQPAVLILDEPTAGLDPQGRRGLLKNIDAWQRETGSTLIVVSHDLAALAQLVDRVLVLSDGRIVADGPSRSVLGDVTRLRGAGLEPPLPVALLHELRTAGWNVATDQIRSAEAAAEIASYLRRPRRTPGTRGFPR